MCGILGLASKDIVIDRNKLLLGSKFLHHRGPDDSGTWVSEDSCVGFAHTRLSIVDLSSNGHQPMVYANEDIVITFNGEIYNYSYLRQLLLGKDYSFKSKTDTEVILAAYLEWGVDCVKYFKGMFAFAIYDSRNKSIFISRDRAGEKPIYYHYSNGIFRFASELKGILSDNSLGRSINLEALDCFLLMGFIPGEKCILNNFSKLPAAHSLVFNIEKNEIKIKKYWDLPNFKNNTLSESDLIDELDHLLDSSVKHQLIADVPVGVLLSGGVDSSLITAMAARHTDQIKTFTVRFPDQGKFDETEHARKISNHFVTEHIELEALPINEDLLIKLARQFDEPIIDSSMIPMFMVSEVVQKYCKVVLGGDGGDELFGGYEHYSRLLWIDKYFKYVPAYLRESIAQVSDKAMPIGMKGRNWIQSLRYDLSSELPIMASYFDQIHRNSIIEPRIEKLNNTHQKIYNNQLLKNSDLLQRLTRMDFYNYLTEDILVKVDRASMLNSLEIRAPFLDSDIVEFAFEKVPSFLKATSKNKKILLKQFTQRVLPENFDKNRKQGFSIPINNWLKKGKFRDFFYNVLIESDSIFDKDVVLKLLKNQDKGFNNGEKLFGLVMFELWRKEYGASITLNKYE
tara:strand:- start:5781 stop:7658 length:1878 start_codon:yes stop_codon:yes gene_type:complete